MSSTQPLQPWAWPWLLFFVWVLISEIAAADQENRFRSEKYAHGFEGPFPSQLFSSFFAQGPILNYWEKSPACDDGLYTIISPRGTSVRHSGPMILDNEGHMVWFKEYKTTYNANVYEYKGERYLTFWAGDDTVRGHGEGTLYMLNSHYEEKYKLRGSSGRPVDLHEFHITCDETGLLTVYDVRSVDLRSIGGPEAGWIYESIFQEIDIETNELLFQWRASDHFDYSDVEIEYNGAGTSLHEPWDWFHINSVDKDESGNYLISSRYTNSLAYIDGSNGNVLWQIGGKHNSFEDLSSGAATNFSIMVLGGKESSQNPSRGLFINIDTVNMTASVRGQYWNPVPISSQSQGSMQVLENGHVFLGYGYNAAWTEFGEDGEVLCDVNFGPRVGFELGEIISYRAFKQEWIGRPLTRPDVALSGTVAAVSWNGATEVATWVLEGVKRLSSNGTGSGSIEFSFITAVPKNGFETRITLPLDVEYTTLRIVALDKFGEYLVATQGMEWKPEEMNDEIAAFGGDEDTDSDDSKTFGEGHIAPALLFGMGFITAGALAICAWLIYRCLPGSFCGRGSGRSRGHAKKHQGWSDADRGEELDDLELEFGDRDDEALLKAPIEGS
ncbi:hypothetical protein N7478_007527 [Penicillium angulare]|uniref:uncharacterized protein n=1 Tax=Penicillium angulare TaxID=116970 RepID=UPI002541B199|nr:uncharacterized protein N7478_007527 [Penicillium angulare]KAJ5272402.1 hypothetical protein N7478_007527 [Penicillium angulare]